MNSHDIAVENTPLIAWEEECLVLPPPGFDYEEWKSRHEAELADQRALLSLQHEFAVCAILIAVAASLANYAIRNPEHGSNPWVRCLQSLPGDCSALTASVTNIVRSEKIYDLASDVSELTANISLTRALHHNDDIVGQPELATRLSDLCLECVHIFQRLHSCAEAALQTNSLEQAKFIRNIEALVFIAGHGGWPCVREDGAVEVPRWSDRRKSVRLEVNFACEVIVDSTVSKATIANISGTGAALICAAVLDEHVGIQLLLPSAEKIDGRVVWRSGQHFGIRFLEPLTHAQLQATINSC